MVADVRTRYRLPAIQGLEHARRHRQPRQQQVLGIPSVHPAHCRRRVEVRSLTPACRKNLFHGFIRWNDAGPNARAAPYLHTWQPPGRNQKALSNHYK
jgi:hypothetical protein